MRVIDSSILHMIQDLRATIAEYPPGHPVRVPDQRLLDALLAEIRKPE